MELKTWQREVGKVQRKPGCTYFVSYDGQLIESDQTQPAAKEFAKKRLREKTAKKSAMLKVAATKITKRVQKRAAHKVAQIAKLQAELSGMQ
jgi:hypothetical protein